MTDDWSRQAFMQGFNFVSITFKQAVNLLLLFLLDRPMCPDGMHISGRWCSTHCTEAKDTLDSVSYLVNFATLYFIFRCPSPGVFLSPPPSLPSPLLFRECRCRLPRPCQVNSLLFPPPHLNSRPRSPLRHLTWV